MYERGFQNEAVRPEFFVESLPIQLAESFTIGKMQDIEGASVVREDSVSTVWRCYKAETVLPSIGTVDLIIDYKKFNDKNEPAEIFELIECKYIKPNASDVTHEIPIAEMFWYKPEFPEVEHFYDFNLSHRYVHPEFKNQKGLGTKLYLQSESLLQDIANLKNSEIIIALVTVQSDVMKWIQKSEIGYSAYSEEDIATLKELAQHPDRFETESVDYDNGQGMRDNFIYRRGSPEKKYVPVWFKKILTPNTPK